RAPDTPILCPVTESQLKQKGYRANWGVEEEHLRQKLAVQFFQDPLGGFDAMVLGFLENGNAAEVGICKQYSVVRMRKAAALFGENRTDGRADHGVAHAHDVHARDALANIRVHTLKVIKDGFFPI